MRGTVLLLLLASCGTPTPLARDAGPRDAGVLDLSALPADTWSYVPVPGAVCGNGSPAAIGVNPHAGATQLLVVIEGGGACWDDDTCFVQSTAVHVHEDYSRSIFTSSVEILGSAGIDDRHATTNAFRDFDLVFVPYCTGDLHGGDAVQIYDPARPDRLLFHRGGRNMQLYLEAMRTAWPAIARTVVVGFSAGGYGAQIQWGHFADAWPASELAILADCSPLVATPLYATWRASWNLDTPADCPECATTFAAYDDYYASRHPSSRFALLAASRDAVVSSYFGVTDMPAALSMLFADHLDHDANVRYFVADTDSHVLLDDVPSAVAVDGTPIGSWVAAFLANDPSWRSTR